MAYRSLSQAVLLALCCLISSPWSSAARADFVINVTYTGNAAYQSYFTSAANVWQSLITGYSSSLIVNRSPGSSYAIGQNINAVNISAVTRVIDGVGTQLGGGGPTEVVQNAAGRLLASDGAMDFDIDDIPGLIATNRFEAVVLHEMAHVLGIGTLWGPNGLYTDGTGEYSGANANQVWQNEFGQTGTPDVELEGGAGTANGHWNENFQGTGLVGIVDGQGRDMQGELMTGWLNSNSFISNLTLASFRDLGFTTVPSVSAVPEPTSLALITLIGMPALALARKRSRRSPQAAAAGRN